jgi:hypothetical protein
MFEGLWSTGPAFDLSFSRLDSLNLDSIGDEQFRGYQCHSDEPDSLPNPSSCTAMGACQVLLRNASTGNIARMSNA